MVTVAMSCVKYLLFFFNLLFAITGIAILVIGSLLQGMYHNYSSFVNENFTFLPIVIIVAGAIIFIIAFCGCFGAMKENHCMISTFASLLLLIFIMEVVAVVGAFIFQNDLMYFFTERMNSSIAHYETDPNVSKSWDILQTDLHCCGVKGVADWKNQIPQTCCPGLHLDEKCTTENAFTQGCLNKIYSFAEGNAMILIIVASVVAIIQLAGVIFACCLAHSIRKGYETV